MEITPDLSLNKWATTARMTGLEPEHCSRRHLGVNAYAEFATFGPTGRTWLALRGLNAGRLIDVCAALSTLNELDLSRHRTSSMSNAD